ncbi:unnamed protein product [Protopolystoma xenopodis]|uniref:Uncharacterized protein n=1 Tax=Protopolystoma xenopodis TaxID=117903 RepID=A0A3S5FH69_9PLAT|nr:unnamed protein product [Protopolystoma xenopodis]
MGRRLLRVSMATGIWHGVAALVFSGRWPVRLSLVWFSLAWFSSAQLCSAQFNSTVLLSSPWYISVEFTSGNAGWGLTDYPARHQRIEKADILNMCYNVLQGIANIVQEQPSKQIRMPHTFFTRNICSDA